MKECCTHFNLKFCLNSWAYYISPCVIAKKEGSVPTQNININFCLSKIVLLYLILNTAIMLLIPLCTRCNKKNTGI